jgi:restriction endonuclease S subunit
VLPKYLEYVIRSANFQEILQRRTKQSSQGGIYLKDIKAIPLSVPPLAEQEQVVTLLNEADELRKLRAKADHRTAELIPALFNEMFGDPETNPMGWPAGKLGDYCELNNGFPFKPTDWDGIGLPIIRIQNLNDREKPFNSTSKVLPDKFLVRPGDILLSWSGTPGTSFGCFRWDGPRGWLNQHIFNVRLNPRLEGEFFIQSVNARLSELIAKAHGGVGLQHVTKGILNSLELLIPPVSLQEMFSKQVNEIHNFAADQAASRLRLEALFQSLLHRAFNAEL